MRDVSEPSSEPGAGGEVITTLYDAKQCPREAQQVPGRWVARTLYQVPVTDPPNDRPGFAVGPTGPTAMDSDGAAALFSTGRLKYTAAAAMRETTPTAPEMSAMR